jgi:hypothetical protein
MERLKFSFQERTLQPKVTVPYSVWEGIEKHEPVVAETITSLSRNSEAAILQIYLNDNDAEVRLNLSAFGRMHAQPENRQLLLRGLMSFFNGLHRVAGPERQDTHFRFDGSTWPLGGKFALRAAILWPVNMRSRPLEQVVDEAMWRAKEDLRWGNKANDDIGCAIGPGYEATLFTGQNRRTALKSGRSRRTAEGVQVLLKAESIPSIDESFICLIGALALARAEELPIGEIPVKIPR